MKYRLQQLKYPTLNWWKLEPFDYFLQQVAKEIVKKITNLRAFKDSNCTFGARVRRNSWCQELLHSRTAGAERVKRWPKGMSRLWLFSPSHLYSRSISRDEQQHSSKMASLMYKDYLPFELFFPSHTPSTVSLPCLRSYTFLDLYSLIRVDRFYNRC